MGLSNRRPRRHTGRSIAPRRRGQGPCFVVQHHEKRDDRFDLRLEIDGVLVSWAIPRGPDANPQNQRMARRIADHPLDQSGIEVDDDVTVLDHGTYANTTGHEMATCLRRGHLAVLLNGQKMHGGYALTRVREGEDETWLLVKRRDGATDAVNRFKRER